MDGSQDRGGRWGMDGWVQAQGWMGAMTGDG